MAVWYGNVCRTGAVSARTQPSTAEESERQREALRRAEGARGGRAVPSLMSVAARGRRIR